MLYLTGMPSGVLGHGRPKEADVSTAESKASGIPAPSNRMTYEEFLDWADEDSRAEWVDGRVVVASPASARHQNAVAFVFRIIARYVELQNLGQVFVAPFQQKLPHSGREPDVLFVATAHLDRLRPERKPNRVVGPADLVVEVVSVPESVERDREDKFREYQQGGVPEYWLISPDDREADFFQLNAHGVYQSVAVDEQGVYTSRELPGLWLKVDWLWQDPKPDVEQLMREIAGRAYAKDLAARTDDAFLRTLLDELRQQGKLPGSGPLET